MGEAAVGVNGHARPASTPCGRQQIGRRFWALVAVNDGEDEDAETGGALLESLSMPFDWVCELLNSSYSEEEVAMIAEEVLPSGDPARAGLHAGEKLEMIR